MTTGLLQVTDESFALFVWKDMDHFTLFDSVFHGLPEPHGVKIAMDLFENLFQWAGKMDERSEFFRENIVIAYEIPGLGRQFVIVAP